jgi:hypothetical protein
MSDYLNNAKSSIGNATEAIQQNLPDTNVVASNISNSANAFRESAQSVTADFSSQGVTNASQEFLNSNSIIARFVFVILVLIVFMALLNIGIGLVTYLVTPSKSPYIIHGMLSGTAYNVYPQDPASGTAVVYRSNNQSGGIEFTWGIWLKIDVMPKDDNYYPVFVKGNDQYDRGIATVNNGPGLYLFKENSSTNGNASSLKLLYRMDVVSPNDKSQSSAKDAVIGNLPIGKWFHIAIRMQNKTMDCYVNGVITTRVSFGDFIEALNLFEK